MSDTLDIQINKGFSYYNTIAIQDENGNPANLSPYEIKIDFLDTSGEVVFSASETTGQIVDLGEGTVQVHLTPSESELIKSGKFILYGETPTEKVLFASGSVTIFPEQESNISYLIPYLRVKIGDTSGERYLDSWLTTALVLAVKMSQRYFGDKYLVLEDNTVIRNPNYAGTFVQDFGVIETRDEPVIVTLAAIIVLEGSLENSAWDAVSWKDAEISFSNLEQFRTRGDILDKLIDSLNSLTLPPTKRLGKPHIQSMWGYDKPEKLGKF